MARLNVCRTVEGCYRIYSPVDYVQAGSKVPIYRVIGLVCPSKTAGVARGFEAVCDGGYHYGKTLDMLLASIVETREEYDGVDMYASPEQMHDVYWKEVF